MRNCLLRGNQPRNLFRYKKMKLVEGFAGTLDRSRRDDEQSNEQGVIAPRAHSAPSIVLSFIRLFPQKRGEVVFCFWRYLRFFNMSATAATAMIMTAAPIAR